MEFDYTIKHTQGKLHEVPDCVSRNHGREGDPRAEEITNEISMLALEFNDVSRLQSEDPDYRRILEAVKDPDRTTTADRRQARSFILEDGILCYEGNTAVRCA